MLKHMILLALLCVSAAGFAKTNQLNQYEYKQVNSALSLIEQQQPQQAKRVLVKLEQTLKPLAARAYALAITRLNLAQLALSGDHYQQALHYYQLAVDSNTLEPAQLLQLMLVRAQLNLALQHWAIGAELLETWLSQAEPSSIAASHYQLLAQAKLQQQQWRAGAEAIERAISMQKSATVPINWYQMAMVSRSQLSQWRLAIKWQKQLLSAEPKKMSHWYQLAALLMQNKDEPAALASLRLAYQQGLFEKPSQYTLLSQLLIRQGNAYLAAQILEQAMQRGQLKRNKRYQSLLSQAWLLAKQQKQASAALAQLLKIDDSEANLRQYAQLLLQQQQWNKALDVLQHLADKQAKVEPRLWLMMGIANIHLGQLSRAQQLIAKAETDDKLRNESQVWLNYISQVQAG
ncbi:hypothetical protein [Agarivorans sp. QJM3NY_25]|uniref:hypothetical protein n=1 Tax=Agarivorans sp. QJM3NY_25 TaxID=3421430 RepID=UPI003D7C4400